MTAKLFLIILLAYLEMTNSQYFGQPSSYQPYNYYPSPSPVAPSIYGAPSFAPPVSSYPAYPPISASSLYSTPGYVQSGSTIPPVSLPTYTQSAPTFAPGPLPSYTPSSQTFAPAPPQTYTPTFAPMQSFAPPTYAQAPTYAPNSFPVPSYAQTPNYPSPISTPTPALNLAQSSGTAPKCSPPTAIAYYLTVPENPKAAVLTEKVKENLLEKSPAQSYPCPFCTGFANVPKNSKVPPPPPSSSVLPGILDKIPTIAIPEELKIKKIGKFASPCLPELPDLFEHKLSGKIRFDQDLLDGFLTGLGLGK